jgi:predicted Zn-dependent protease
MAVFRTRGCRERIRDDYLEAERLSRFDPTIPLELAMLLLDLGDPVGARRAAERALALEPEAVLSRIVLAEALIEAGSAAAAGRSAELLFEAERKAEQWAGFAKGNHAGRLLALDRAQLERVRRKVATAASVDAPAEGALR